MLGQQILIYFMWFETATSFGAVPACDYVFISAGNEELLSPLYNSTSVALHVRYFPFNQNISIFCNFDKFHNLQEVLYVSIQHGTFVDFLVIIIMIIM